MQTTGDGVNALPLDGPVIAVDIGGTWTRVGLTDATGLHDVRRIPTPTDASDPLGVIATALEPLLEFRPVALGISATGPVDPGTGRLLDVPNAPALSGLDLRDGLRHRLGLPAAVERDTNAALLAEHTHGAAVGHADVVYLTFSTGVGGAVLVGGRLLRGARGVAGELGHVVVQLDGPACGCGRFGCLEAVASGDGLGRAATEHARRHPGSPLGRRLTAGAGGAGLSGRDVAAAADPEQPGGADPEAVRLLDRAGRAFVSAVVDLANTFDPQLVVVGGSIARAHPEWLTTAQAAVATAALAPERVGLTVVPAALGEDAELVGAGLVGAEAGRGIGEGLSTETI